MKRLQISDQDLITVLRRMAPETGALICLGCGHERSCSIHGCAVLLMAADRLKELAAPPPNPPLTLEELWEMDGKPVWCQSDYRPEGAGWHLVNATAKQMHEFILIEAKRGIPCAGIETGYWQAYRRKPEKVSQPLVEPTVPDWAEHLRSRFLRAE